MGGVSMPFTNLSLGDKVLSSVGLPTGPSILASMTPPPVIMQAPAAPAPVMAAQAEAPVSTQSSALTPTTPANAGSQSQAYRRRKADTGQYNLLGTSNGELKSRTLLGG